MPLLTDRRSLIPILIVFVAFIALTVLIVLVGRDPVMEGVEPRVVSPGDQVTVTGRHFGTNPATLLVGGRTLPTTAIRSWSDREIRFVVPRNAGSGLLYVETERGRSDGMLIQVRESIPRTSFTGEGPGVPVITGIDVSELQIGGLVTLTGANFGRTRRGSRVVYPMQGGIACTECDSAISYAHWSDSRIVVRVPAGATSGFLSVLTPWGRSNPLRVSVARPAGAVLVDQPFEIALRYGARIDGVQTVNPLRVPVPGAQDVVVRLPAVPESVAQRAVRYLDVEPGGTRFEQVDASFERELTRTAIVQRYGVRSQIDVSRVPETYEGATGFTKYYTRELPDFPVNDPDIRDIAARLRTNRRNPYRIAEAAYDFTVERLEYALGRPDRSVRGGLASGLGDSYTYSTLFVTVLRAAGVPARPVGGVVVTDGDHAYPHFWAEFFLTGIGWVPVDPAFGDGAFPAGIPVPDDPRAFYFGNLDNRRVAFLYGYDATERALLDGVQVMPDEPYTLQRSYVEAGPHVDSLRVQWHVPRIIGQFKSD